MYLVISSKWCKTCLFVNKWQLLKVDISCVKTWHAMCLKENMNGGGKRAYKLAFDVINVLSWWKVNLIYGDQHSPEGQDFTKV